VKDRSRCLTVGNGRLLLTKRSKSGVTLRWALAKLAPHMERKGKATIKARPVARSGRFATGPAAAVAQFTESISFDWRLWRQDIAGSRAHARMLHRVGLLTRRELQEIERGLKEIECEIEQGRFRWRPELEDVHMNIEAALTERTPAGAKLHTARSRNDQVALDMRMWLRDHLKDLDNALMRLQKALVDLGAAHEEVVIPGYTHLQRAQPVFLAHHLLAYVEMLERDRERFADAYRRTNVCPLGSGALAGSTLPLDREAVARELGFVDEQGQPRISQNSMDAVSDRDFVVEYNAAAALLAVHLSRLAEDLVLWSGAEFGFIQIGDAYTTGSSLMPQKKNPDVAELARGKTGRVVGNLVALLTLLKGLPMTYNRDLQEDKERLFDTADTVLGTVSIMADMLGEVSVRGETCAGAAADPLLLATDLADYLVRRGVPFREAHHLVGSVVALAEKMGKPLDQWTHEEFQKVDRRFGADAPSVFNLREAMDRRNLAGAPGRQEVRRQLERWQRKLQPRKG